VAARPDPRAEVKALAALALDLARLEPHRRPGPEIQRWHRELADLLGAAPRSARTNRDLVLSAIALRRLADAAPPPPPRPARAPRPARPAAAGRSAAG
jgi:hypothetical protein